MTREKVMMMRIWMAACGVVAFLSVQSVESQPGAPPTVLYEGARLISGTGSAPIEQSAFLVERGTITRVGRKGALAVPA
ncbi:MAG TPA: hypothetical protein VIX63_14795, partial [Vicinamibacterales bacterium]